MKYVFVGEGMGIPGLPHEISDKEANELGVADLLQEAVENGNYKAIVQKPERAKRTGGTPDLSLESED